MTSTDWKENSDDVVTVGSKRRMTHKERYEFVKNRVYYPMKSSKEVNSDRNV